MDCNLFTYVNMNLLFQEARVFKDLVLSDTSKGLVHVFFAQRATSKVEFIVGVLQTLKPFSVLFLFSTWVIDLYGW